MLRCIHTANLGAVALSSLVRATGTHALDKDDTKPRSDWRISEEWAWFIGEHRGSLKLTTKPEPYSFERTLHWLSHQVAPTLKLALRLDKMNHTQIVHDIITHARLTEKHEKILKQQAAAAKEVVL